MIIGIDFDNTIVCYDGLFYKVACELGLIPHSCGKTKNEVRDYLRENDSEEMWTKLQGIVYGSKMGEAKPFPGVLDFFETMHDMEVICCIISHKTEFAKKGERFNLHNSALSWLSDNGFFSPKTGLKPEKVFFNETRVDKIQKIIECGCTHFIDDLPEVFLAPYFPESVEKILFVPTSETLSINASVFDSWKKIKEYLCA